MTKQWIGSLQITRCTTVHSRKTVSTTSKPLQVVNQVNLIKIYQVNKIGVNRVIAK